LNLNILYVLTGSVLLLAVLMYVRLAVGGEITSPSQ
jgi:hypothetical protein